MLIKFQSDGGPVAARASSITSMRHISGDGHNDRTLIVVDGVTIAACESKDAYLARVEEWERSMRHRAVKP